MLSREGIVVENGNAKALEKVHICSTACCGASDASNSGLKAVG